MRNFEIEFRNRTQWIKDVVFSSGCKGVVFGNSGGKDSALVGILCKAAVDNVVGLIMPCQSKRNFGEDKTDAEIVAAQYQIETKFVDLTEMKNQFEKALDIDKEYVLTNINPRLRMIALYAVAQDRNCLVAGTGNLSERTMGYFTKFGDGASDFNPIADLTATEVKAFLKYLNAPQNIYQKAPSAGLFDGQTDELDMGLSYNDLDNYILNGKASAEIKNKVDNAYKKTRHKRSLPLEYQEK